MPRPYPLGGRRLRAGVWKYWLLRRLSRVTVSTASALTLGRMPPFVGAAAIITRSGKVMMIRDPSQGMLVLPGGHLHWRETVDVGLRREVLEETGYAVRPTKLLATVDSSMGLADRGIIRVIMEAEIVSGEERSSPEGTVEWLDLHDAAAREERDCRIVRAWLEGTLSA